MKQEFNKLKDKVVLIVDDDEILRKYMCLEMMNHGMNCTVATNSKEAFLAIKENKIDIVVSDINMPGGSALDLLKEIKNVSNIHKPKIILISGYTELTIDEIKKLGANEILLKPFGVNELLDKMNGVIA